MPGGTQKYGLPYLLNTEGLWTIGNVTKLLAERLEALIDTGTLRGAQGDRGPAGGPIGPGATLMRTTAQSIPASTGTVVSWTMFDWDIKATGQPDAQQNTGGLVCRTAGKYMITAQIPWANSATGLRVMKLRHNGANVAESCIPGTAWENVNTIAVMLALVPGDTLSVELVQSSGAALNACATLQGGINARLSMQYLAP